MYFPCRIDLHSLKSKKPRETKTNTLGRKRTLPVEATAVHEITNRFVFISLLCQTTYYMECSNPGSSNIHFLDPVYNKSKTTIYLNTYAKSIYVSKK